MFLCGDLRGGHRPLRRFRSLTLSGVHACLEQQLSEFPPDVPVISWCSSLEELNCADSQDAYGEGQMKKGCAQRWRDHKSHEHLRMWGELQTVYIIY